MKQKFTLFIPRTKDSVKQNPDVKIGDKLENLWGQPALGVLEYLDGGHFDFGNNGRNVYVISGHGTPNLETCYWGKANNTVTATEVATSTANRFPMGDIGDVRVKIYSCHSAESGENAFAKIFATHFQAALQNRTGTVTVYGYEGAISVQPIILTGGNIQDATQAFPNSAHKNHLVKDASHRYTKKVYNFEKNYSTFWGRASDGRIEIAKLQF